MLKNNLIALISQTIVGIIVLISSIYFLFGSSYAYRTESYGRKEEIFSIVIFVFFILLFLLIGTKMEVQKKRVDTLFSVCLPFVICIILIFAKAFILEDGPKDLSTSIRLFVEYTYIYNFGYPVAMVSRFNGYVAMALYSIFPTILLFTGLEVKRIFNKNN